MKKLQIPLAILLGAVIGAGGYFAAGKLSGKPQTKHDDEAATVYEVAKLRRTVAELQGKIAKLEARPSFQDALNDPAMREQLAAIVVETRSPGAYRPRPPQPGSETWRKSMAGRYRSDYTRILGEARKAMKLDEGKYKKALPVFQKHFAPVEAFLKDFESGKARTPPRVNQLVAPRLPATLAELKKTLPPDSMKAFDEWRKSPEAVKTWGASQGDYFLAGEDFKDFRVKRAALMNWPVLRRELAKFYEKVKLDDAKKKKFEGLLKSHLEKVYQAVRDQERPSLLMPANQAKVRTITKATEAELAKLLGFASMAKFREWKTTPGMRSCYYFGERYRSPRPGPGRGPGTYPERKPPVPGEKF